MLHIEVVGPIARVVLDRPELHNAFNGELTRAVSAAFRDLGNRPDVRVIVLAGAGKSFCAGGDLNWMRQEMGLTYEENLADVAELFDMLQTIAACPKPVMARVHGAAFGGGVGLLAAADIALAVESAVFGFTEVRIGVVPAVISPFVLPRIGVGRAREYFLTGERFSAATAHSIGLVHSVHASAESLDDAIHSKIESILSSAPGAIAATKALIAEIATRPRDAAIAYAEEALARARSGEEGQAGMGAFLEGRKPPWVKS